MPDRTLLLIDDDPQCWALLTRLAARYAPQWEVVAVGTLDEAVACLRQRPFDLVLLDLNLHEVQGVLTLHQFFALAHADPRRGVVVLTGLPEDLEPTVLAAGAIGFMGKMRMTDHPQEFWAFLESCRREAANDHEGGNGGAQA